MESGVKTSIISGMPLEKEAALKKAMSEKQVTAKLGEDAAKLGLSQSQDGILLQGLVKKVAIARIETLVRDDPEMIAYVNILKELGHTENLAEKAYRTLHERYIRAID